MTRRINYEDDIFTVALQVRCLQDALKLEVDAELFAERIAGDIGWIDAISGSLYRSLRESSLYVKRQEHLRELAKVKRYFSEALENVLERKAPLSDALLGRLPGLRALKEAQVRDVDEIKLLLEGKGTPEDEHIVSPEELKYLMTSDEEEESPRR
ncbi:MAG TPA: hypothetical protein VMF68_08535 [Spirochaetia bacterium]|nr:hypothetical protein [Spirochaetia bacterium]